jgi:transcriptional antiterminator RfaH
MLHVAGKTGAKWAVVSTHRHKERIAIEHLRRQNFRVYCPMISRTIRHARRHLKALRPLFPGYLFVQVVPTMEQWRPIASTTGVRNLVRFGDELGLLEDGLIEGLKARERDGVIAPPQVHYRAGQNVQLVGGPFDGVIATILSASEKDRLVVLINLLHTSVRATLDMAQAKFTLLASGSPPIDPVSSTC